jgi:hypothetical protein
MPKSRRMWLKIVLQNKSVQQNLREFAIVQIVFLLFIFIIELF